MRFWDGVQEGPRAREARCSRRRARSDSESEGPLVHRNRFSVLSSDSDDAPLARLGIQSPEGGTTVPASSPHAVTVTEEPVHREFEMTLQDSGRVSQTIHREIRAAAEMVDNLGSQNRVSASGRSHPEIGEATEMVAFQCAVVLGRCQFGTEFSCGWSGSWRPHLAFHEGQVAPQEAARIGWLALRKVNAIVGHCFQRRSDAMVAERDFRQFNQAITLELVHRRFPWVAHARGRTGRVVGIRVRGSCASHRA